MTATPTDTATPTSTSTAASTASPLTLTLSPASLGRGDATPLSIPTLALPGLALAALAAAALLLARRKRTAPRLVEVMESTSLGPKRALVLARLGGEVLLLGSSEAGITLLGTQPALAPVPDAPAGASPPPARPRGLAAVVAKLAPARRAPAVPPAFDALLAESAEDQELRRKIAAGRAGLVP
jgi:flagellar biogenesis protein FliO